jgi:hypothetical protein
MSADSETASYTSATALSDSDRQPCPVRRRLHATRSADHRFGRLRSPVTNPGCVRSQRAGRREPPRRHDGGGSETPARGKRASAVQIQPQPTRTGAQLRSFGPGCCSANGQFAGIVFPAVFPASDLAEGVTFSASWRRFPGALWHSADIIVPPWSGRGRSSLHTPEVMALLGQPESGRSRAAGNPVLDWCHGTTLTWRRVLP